MKKVRIASVQIEHAEGDKQANHKKIAHWVSEAKKQNVDIISFPEMCITGYFYLKDKPKEVIEALSEPVGTGESSTFLKDLATKNNMTIAAGIIEKSDEGKLYNTYLIALPDGKILSYRKIHCFVNANMDSGDEYLVFDDPHGIRIGVLICYDNNIVENVRMCALQGAELILAPHQTGAVRSPDKHAMGIIDRQLWDNRTENPEAIEAEFKGDKGRGWLLRWLPSRAHDNGIFYCFSNGVGVDGDEIRTGNAMIIDPYGRILTETWKANDDMVVADLDPALRGKSTGERWIKTRRPDLYKPLAIPTGNEVDTKVARFDGGGV